MKTLTISTLLLLSLSAFAQSGSSDFNQRKLLCNSIDRMLENEQADAAVDMDACLDNTDILQLEQSKSGKVIIGKVPFNSPERSFSQTCQISYHGFFEKGILVGAVTDARCF